MFGAFFAPQELKRNRTKTWKGTGSGCGTEQTQNWQGAYRNHQNKQYAQKKKNFGILCRKV